MKFLTLISAFLSKILLLGVVLTVMTFLGRLGWGFELTTHFRVQYVLLFSILSILMMVKKDWVLMGISSVCLMIHLAAVLPAYMASRENPGERSTQTIKILLSNVRVKNSHHDRVLELISKENPDIVVLQEVNSRWLESLQPVAQIYPYQKIAKGRHYERIVLYSRHPVVNTREKYLGSYKVAALVATLDLQNRPFTIFTTHLTSPTSPRDARARNQALMQLAQEMSGTQEPAILLGDLNITPWSPYFYDLIRSTGWKDSREGFGIQASWPTLLFPPFSIPLDHCLVHPSVHVVNRSVGPNIGSDHYPILIELTLSNADQPAMTITRRF